MIVVVAMILVAGLILGTTTLFQSLSNRLFPAAQEHTPETDAPEAVVPSADYSELNELVRESMGLFGPMGDEEAPLTSEELTHIQAGHFSGASIAPDERGVYQTNFYRVGIDLPAGSYWMGGSSRARSSFIFFTRRPRCPEHIWWFMRIPTMSTTPWSLRMATCSFWTTMKPWNL